MTKHIFTYLLTLLVLASCAREESVKYTINGKLHEGQSKIILLGLNERFRRVDSIITDEEGRFTYSLENDTTVPLSLFMPGGEEITLFAEPGINATLLFDSVSLRHRVVGGGTAQRLYDSISHVIESCDDKEKRIKIIEDFIKSHPLDETGIELIRRYMVYVPGQDNSKIKSTILKLSGVLQDDEYVAVTKKKIESRTLHSLHKLFPSFTYVTADSSKKVSLNTFNKKYTLITFWAPWDKASRESLKKLRLIDDSIKSENFAILNIALDYDTTAWRDIAINDTIPGYNVCESKSWNSDIVSKFDIDSLPYSMLLSPYQRIIRYNVDLVKDFALMDSLTKKHDKTLEERKKREEREKRNKEKKNKRNKK